MGFVEAHEFGCKNKKNYPYRTLIMKIKILMILNILMKITKFLKII